jgi:AraC-like DNA-binding protein
MRQGEREVLLDNGAAALADPNYPYELKMTNDSQQLVLLIPSASLRVAGRTLSDIRSRLIPGDSLALRNLSMLATELVLSDGLDSEAEGTAAAVIDLMRAALARFGTTDSPVDMSHGAQLRLVQDFIHKNLSDPGLSVDYVARAHQVSARHLTTLFGPDSTPGSFIRRARLERIYSDLTNPEMGTVTASRIAARWGFDNYATLNRAFHREFGISPSQIREYSQVLPSKTRTTPKQAEALGAHGGPPFDASYRPSDR